MTDPTSIIKFDELTKPANTLIEKISEAIGGIFRPRQIRRIAQAEADAEKIRAASQIEISDIQRRALVRFVAEEGKKQNNIETITTKALPQLNEQAHPEHVEDDWITNFFDKCRLISDEEMQALWAKILAGEANTPGNFSRRTIDLLGSFDKSDAVLFCKLCSFGFHIGREVFPLIYDTKHSIYKDNGITFATISHLESIGLAHFNHLAGYVQTEMEQKGLVGYFGSKILFELPKPEGNVLQLGHVILTTAGHQLARICGPQPVEGFLDYVREKWRSFGYKAILEGEEIDKGNNAPGDHSATTGAPPSLKVGER